MPPNSLNKVQDKMTSLAGGVIETFVNSNERKPLKSQIQYEELESAEHDFSAKRLLKTYIIFFTALSLILNLGMAIAGFIIAIQRDSAATYAFAADCLLDMISSMILLWRYSGKESLEAQNKEKKACIFLGSMFILSALAVITKAAVDISQREPPVMFKALYILAILGVIFCLFMAVSKFLLARKADSGSLMLDAVNSLISSFLALVIIVSTLVYHYDRKIWHLDPTLSIVVCFLLIAYGSKVIYDHRGKQPNPT